MRQKLSLKKVTISNLNQQEMFYIRGGLTTVEPECHSVLCPTDNTRCCILTRPTRLARTCIEENPVGG